MIVLLFVLQAIWFIGPAGIANIAPVLLKPVFPWLAKPIDFGKTINGEPVFGKNKTWRGLLAAPIFGMLTFWLQEWLYQIESIQTISIIDYSQAPLWWGALLGLGALVGDLIKSFFKRRFKIPPGVSWFPFDQIDFVLGAVLFLSPFFFPGWWFFFGLIVVGIFLHLIANALGHMLKLRKDWI